MIDILRFLAPTSCDTNTFLRDTSLINTSSTTLVDSYSFFVDFLQTAKKMPGSGYGVAAGLLPAILFGGVLGAGCGTVLLYGGAVDEDPTIENIFEEKVQAHSVKESNLAIKAASVMEPRNRYFRGFAAMFA
ncbi:hypothetical protein CEUSTIGMA_g8409.t1 [Chlamydomonas eustigma]|uniref:Uncharacterized protein n=1 Tax=Chlamydomonas eustigma TaxID=1157962 RepID=A0A250XD18_9CHLO|nr:hypothetical protein CEUSTIGMA_g8409.t1 [Chlamydomonas eustigma]|eukprot:GAX80974.1 hypothetical protein CEUSTIGMA_g8409.t1 [Chlamydomonas eustigma]